MSSFFYDGQLRRYVTQFMRVFIGFKWQAGDGTEKTVPVMYGDMTRQVAAIIRENSENKLPSVPRIACYMTKLDMDRTRLSDPSFVSKVNIRERRYTEDVNGVRDYQGIQGGNYTVERLLPTPYTLNMKADIWTSNTDQKLQLMEQILVLFNPSLELQTTDNFVDWTSITVLNLENLSLSSRTIPQGVDSEIDICSMEFSIPIWISPPAKVKKLGVVRSIIANVFTETGDIVGLEDLIFNKEVGDIIISNHTVGRYRVLLFKANNGQPYDYELTLVDFAEVISQTEIDQKSIKSGEPIAWNMILDSEGGYLDGVSQVRFTQPSGLEMIGTIAVNPVDPTIIVVTFDQDTIPANTLIASTINGISARGTIDAIIDPYKYNPIEVYGTQSAIPLGIRFLMLDDINPSTNVGSTVDGPPPFTYDGPDAWKNLNGSDPVIPANSIVEWTGTEWVVIWDPATGLTPTYFQNLRTEIKYRWDGLQWLKAFEGEYAPGYWAFNLNP